MVSSRQRSYDRLRCEEESGKMGKSTLIDLINQVQDIKNLLLAELKKAFYMIA